MAKISIKLSDQDFINQHLKMPKNKNLIRGKMNNLIVFIVVIALLAIGRSFLLKPEVKSDDIKPAVVVQEENPLQSKEFQEKQKKYNEVKKKGIERMQQKAHEEQRIREERRGEFAEEINNPTKKRDRLLEEMRNRKGQ